jgi:hypothetical protein
MWQWLLVAAIAVVVFGFSIRRQLRFLLGPTNEVSGRILAMEPFLVEDGSHWFTRCTVEYEVKGRLYQRFIERREPPQLGDIVTLTYPERRPGEAIEGSRKAASKQQVWAVVAGLLLLLLLIVFGGHQSAPPK